MNHSSAHQISSIVKSFGDIDISVFEQIYTIWIFENRYTVVAERVQYFVLLNYSFKSWSIIKGTVLESARPEDSKTPPGS